MIINNIKIRISKLYIQLRNIYQGLRKYHLFRILDFGHSYLFRISCFEFIENFISKQFSLSQHVISLNDVALVDTPFHWYKTQTCGK